MQSNAEPQKPAMRADMSGSASRQLAYAAGYRRPALVHGARVDARALQSELERIVKGTVVYLEESKDSAKLADVIAKADAVHIACDYTVSAATLSAVRAASARKPKPAFVVVSTRALQLSDLDSSVQKIFPSIVAWGEVF